MLSPDQHLLPWYQVPLVVIDFETTGLSHEKDAPVSIGIVRFENQLPVAQFGSFVDPGMPVPEQATAIHGITDADLVGAPSLLDAIKVAYADGMFDEALPCAYNAPFDKPWLHRAGYSDDLSDCLALDTDWPWVDPLVIVRDVDRFVKGRGRHKLTTVCERYGVDLANAHRAVDDAKATGELLYQLVPKIGDITASELLRRQGRKAHQQQVDFDNYKARMAQAES